MTQTVFPEFVEAADGLRKRISLTESEIAPLKKIVRAKEQLIREWRGVINTLVPGSETDPLDVNF